MYSVVLMMALSGGAQTPEFCHGCWGGGGGCYGGGWSSCGCYGGGGYGGGCYSGGWSSCGCYGGGYSGGGCYSGGWSGCSSYGCGGCYGGASYGCGGYSGGCCASGHPAPAVAPGVLVPDKKGPPPPPPPPPPKKGVNGVNGENSARATIKVTLPENAKLTFDSFETTQTSAERTFHTPALPMGRDYVYTLRAEAMVDGQSVVKSETVNVRAGQTTRLTFDFGTAGVAAR